MRKTRDLMIILGIYVLAFVLGYFTCFQLDGIMLQIFVFDVAATVVVFVFSVLLHNSSVWKNVSFQEDRSTENIRRSPPGCC